MIWTVIKREHTGLYEPRCSRCGRYPLKLLKHWFFSGLYCHGCVQDVLYDNMRNIKEINNVA